MPERVSNTARGVSPGACASSRLRNVTLRAVGQKTDQNVRLNAQLDVVADRAQWQVTLERFEGRLDLAQLHVAFPERPCLVASAKATQQVMAVALLGLLEFVLE